MMMQPLHAQFDAQHYAAAHQLPGHLLPTANNKKNIPYGLPDPYKSFWFKYLVINYIVFTILYYTILYYTILYYTILYYTILYYTILYYTILYYTILYYTV